MFLHILGAPLLRSVLTNVAKATLGNTDLRWHYLKPGSCTTCRLPKHTSIALPSQDALSDSKILKCATTNVPIHRFQLSLSEALFTLKTEPRTKPETEVKPEVLAHLIWIWPNHTKSFIVRNTGGC